MEEEEEVVVVEEEKSSELRVNNGHTPASFQGLDVLDETHRLSIPASQAELICKSSQSVRPSVSNGYGLSLRVRVRVRTEPEPDRPSGLSMNLNCRFRYGSIDISLPVRIGQVLSGLYSMFICKYI